MIIKQLNEIKVTPYGARKWKLLRLWKVQIGTKIIKVNKGFIFDFATVPRILWIFFPPATGNYRIPSLLHDWMYVNAFNNKEFADTIFLKFMRNEGVGFLKRHIMYYGVKLFGRGNYER